MTIFRTFLVSMIVSVVSYTLLVGFNEGWNLFPLFFGDIVAVTWAGQFNLDFTCFLLLAGLWVVWRHRFSPIGLGLGLMVPIGGMIMLASYLLVATFQAEGDMTRVLLGLERTA